MAGIMTTLLALRSLNAVVGKEDLLSDLHFIWKA
jgi:hypothetical protein